MNIFIATGNLGQDATQQFTQSGDSLVTFSLAIKSGYGDKAKTLWARCSIFGKRGEGVFQYLLKGTKVGVCGEFSINEWTNKEGQKQSTPEIRVNELDLLGSKPSPEAKPANNKSRAQDSAYDDDLPF